eukprot:19761-Eustigmatos_ZCMA.PRE.1
MMQTDLAAHHHPHLSTACDVLWTAVSWPWRSVGRNQQTAGSCGSAVCLPVGKRRAQGPLSEAAMAPMRAQQRSALLWSKP